jgi:hypothetical protein
MTDQDPVRGAPNQSGPAPSDPSDREVLLDFMLAPFEGEPDRPEVESVANHLIDAAVTQAFLSVIPHVANRAEVLREAADIAQERALRMRRQGDTQRSNGAYEVSDLLRRLAYEAGKPGQSCACGPEGCRYWRDDPKAAELARKMADTSGPAEPHVACACGQDGCEYCDD